ncbi:MAG: hypothetical protein ACP5RN_07975 [Armatimonadota bacterium]
MAPVVVDEHYIGVLTPRWRDGLRPGEVEKRIGRRVRPIPLSVTAEQVEELIRQASP